MKKSRIKKYPIFRYLCCLLLVSVLFTGVTFSRYSLALSGSAGTGVAALSCSYEIEDFSSLNFDNSNYWATVGVGDNAAASATPRTVRFVMRNSRGGKVSDVDVRAHMRLYISAELADKLAIQIATEGEQTTYTPQIPLGELFYGRAGGTNANGTPVLNSGYRDYGDGTPLDTAAFHDYGALAAADEVFTVSGGLGRDGGALTLSGGGEGCGLTMVVASGRETVDYSVGFRRGTSSAPLYLDLRREQVFYTVDITLPAMYYAAGTESVSRHVVYFTLTDRIENPARWYEDVVDNGDGTYSANIDDVFGVVRVTPAFRGGTVGDDGVVSGGTLVTNLNDLITSPSQDYYFLQNGERIDITGYHFEQSAPYADGSGDTTVRVKCVYAAEGGYDISLYHVAPLSENTAYYVHYVSWSGGDVIKGFAYSEGAVSTPFTDAGNGTCSNSEGGSVIDISGVSIDPLGRDVSSAVSRSYYFKLYALFVQASDAR